MSVAEQIQPFDGMHLAGRDVLSPESARTSADFSLFQTPQDKLTGQPLSIFVEAKDFYLDGQDCLKEFHHAQHPGSSTELGCDEGGDLLAAGDPDRAEGLAVRYSVGEDLPAWLHDIYHDRFWGPQLPELSEDKHRAVVLGIAKAVPRQAIQLHNTDTYEIVDLNDREHEFIRRITHHEGAGYGWQRNRRGRIGSYLADYALTHYLPQIAGDMELLLEEFMEVHQELSSSEVLRWRDDEVERLQIQLSLKKHKQRQMFAAGQKIVEQAIMASVEDIRPVFKEAIKAGMVKGTKRDLGQTAIKFFGTRPGYSENIALHIDGLSNKPLQTGVDPVKLAA